MSELRFDDRVAVITGAGRGLGRSYAELLASRGAKVVVNDAGGTMRGDTVEKNVAAEVVDAIEAAGGAAVASTASVATAAGGQEIIDTALDTYGRIDILIHNAGNVRYGLLTELSYEDFDAVLDVHLRGAFHVSRAAFPHMAKAGYGRVVLTSSIGGIYGAQACANYASSKAGAIGLSNIIALEGAAVGVNSNVILPSALTRMAEGIDTSAYPDMRAELVAPAVAYLAHESCTLTGEMLIAIAGRVARAYIAETPGVYQPSWTVDDVAARIDEIRNTDNSWQLPPVPSGQADHIGRSFAMAIAANNAAAEGK
ncbi:SDR family NAD(P)-dependent oxidoreductase [Nocardia sp. BMG111209]|uniref:SDR family NAD(P)-dependent oxidoreductase n=1 Tax=Nocardia sp. BMG111209 TaxID=1160137 RepID=UPI00035E18BA|nr:SDR family NAD(P)-dependent oxidoreductase [Nocardia sp. BMG111209]